MLLALPESPGLNPCEGDVEDQPRCGEHRDFMQALCTISAEKAGRVPLNYRYASSPEPQRRLVYRYEAPVKGDEEEVTPTRKHVLDGSGVVFVLVSLARKPVQVEEGGQDQDRHQGEPLPRRVRHQRARPTGAIGTFPG